MEGRMKNWPNLALFRNDRCSASHCTYQNTIRKKVFIATQLTQLDVELS